MVTGGDATTPNTDFDITFTTGDRYKSGNFQVAFDSELRDIYGNRALSSGNSVDFFIGVGEVLHYTFETYVASTAEDVLTGANLAVTGGFDGTFSSAANLTFDETSGRVSNGWIIDGSPVQLDGGVTLTNSDMDGYNFPQVEGSLEFWFLTPETPDAGQEIFGDTITTGGNYFSFRYLGSGNQYRWAANSSALGGGNTLEVFLALESWNHLAFFWDDDGTHNVVLNGVQQAQNMSLPGFNPTDQDFIFSPGSAIDDVYLHDEVRTAGLQLNTMLANNKLTASWPFDESFSLSTMDNTNDFDGNILVAGVVDNGSSILDEGRYGSGNSIHLEENMSFNGGGFGEHLFPHFREGTLHFWIRPNPTTEAVSVLDKSSTSGNRFVITGTGNLDEYRFDITQGSSNLYTAEVTLQGYAWNHVGITWNTTGDAKLYHNGTEAGSYTMGGWSPDGQRITSSANAYLDEFVVLDTELAQSFFKSEFGDLNVPHALYTFDNFSDPSNWTITDDTGWEFTPDVGGNYHRMYFNGGAPETHEPHYGQLTGNSLYFENGEGMSIYSMESLRDLDNNYFPDDEGSLLFWWKPNYVSNAATTVEVFSSNSNDTRNQFFIQNKDNNNSGDFVFVVEGQTGSISSDNIYEFQPVMERWNHIGVTWGSPNINFYLNGNLHYSRSYPFSPLDQLVSSTPYGALDNVMVSNRFWQATEIEEHYFTFVNNTEEASLFSATYNTAASNVYFALTATTAGDLVPNHDFAANVMRESQVTSRYNYGRLNATYSSNNGHHGYNDDIDYGGTQVSDGTGSIGLGSSENLWIPSLDKGRFPQAEGTLRFWYNPTSTVGGQNFVFGGGNTTNSQKKTRFLSITEQDGNPGFYNFEVHNGHNSLLGEIQDLEFHFNTSNYIAVTWDSADVTLYVNGAYSGNITNGVGWTPADQVCIFEPNGLIDSLYVEGVVRSSGEILTYFQTYFQAIGIYDFDGSPNDLTDGSVWGNDVSLVVGEASGTPSYAAAANEYIDLSDVGDYIQFPLTKDLFPQDEGIVRMWYNPTLTTATNSTVYLWDAPENERNHFFIQSSNTQGAFRFGIQETSGNLIGVYDFNLQKDDWSHLAVNWSSDRDTINLVVNGSVIYSTPIGTWRPSKQYSISTPGGYLDDVYVSYEYESHDEVEDYVFTYIEEPLAGVVQYWGDGRSGQLGDGEFNIVNGGSMNHNLTEVVKVAGGESFSLALLKSGQLMSWGDNTKGQLGDGNVITRSIPDMIPLVNGVVDIACGEDFAVAVLATGNVMTWGFNDKGQLGYSSTDNIVSTPTYFTSITDAVAVEAGAYHAMVLNFDGTVSGWGDNSEGQITGSATSTDAFSADVGVTVASNVACGANYTVFLMTNQTITHYGSGGPTTIDETDFGTGVVGIASGDEHNLYLLDDGTVFAAGENDQGQLGDNTQTDAASTPVQVLGETAVTPSGLTSITGISAGSQSSYALSSTGNVFSWGRGTEGQLGFTSSISKVAGNVANVTAMSNLGKSGARHMAGIVTRQAYADSFFVRDVNISFDDNDLGDDGSYNFPGRFFGSPTYGDGHQSSGNIKGKSFTFGTGEYMEVPYLSGNSFPQSEGTVSLWYQPNSNTPDGAEVFDEVDDTRDGHFALRYNGNGNVGLYLSGDTSGTSIPTSSNLVVDLSAPVDDWTLLTFSWDIPNSLLSYGSNDTTASQTVSWGDWRPYGQLVHSTPSGGLDNLKITSTVTSTSEMEDDYQNAISGESSEYVRAWGDNNNGQLEDGTTTNRLTPTLATGLEAPADIGLGLSHNVVLLANGVVRVKGGNSYGQLGTGDYNNVTTLTTISGFEDDVTAIAVGHNFNLALMANGNVMAWGQNLYGQLGLGTSTTTYNTPTVISGLSNVTSIAVGNNHALALDSSNRLWSWGLNTDGQLGLGDTSTLTSPVEVTIAGTVSQMQCGASFSMVLLTSGSVYTWGDNSRGQLGIGSTTDSTSPVQATGLAGITEIAAGDRFCIAYNTSIDTLYGWGYNYYKQIDSSLGSTISSFTTISNSLANVDEIECGADHTLLLMSDGTVRSFGRNSLGQLATGDQVNTSAINEISDLSNIIVIRAVRNSSYALGQ